MLNIEFQCSGMLLVMLSAIFYSRLPKLNLRTTRIFGCMLPIAAVSAFFDIASVFAIYYADSLSDTFVKAVCKIYLVFLMSLVLADFIYLCADAFSSIRTFKKITCIASLIFFSAMAAAMFLPIEYVCEDNGQTMNLSSQADAHVFSANFAADCVKIPCHTSSMPAEFCLVIDKISSKIRTHIL